MRRLLLGAGFLLAVVLQRPGLTANEPPALVPADVEVEQAEGVSSPDQAARAEVRGRLALAKGRIRKAAAEFRNLVSYRQGRLEELKKRLGQMCDPQPLADAQGELAVARVLLAEAENDLEGLDRLLPAVIRYHHSRLLRVERLMLLKAIDPEEGRAAMKPLRQAREAAKARASEVQKQLRRREAARERELMRARIEGLQNEMRLQKGPIFFPISGFPPAPIPDNKYPQ